MSKEQKEEKSKELLKNRIELVFLYDVRDANPNGDPDSNNEPRIDDVTGENIVTDLRLKRTIRDYWLRNEKEILVKAVDDEEGHRESMEERVNTELKIDKKKEKPNQLRGRFMVELPEKFIDVRAFGAAITYPKANVSITGAAQFGLGRSLNLPRIQRNTITSMLASGEEKGQGAIGEYYSLDYSLIKFHGIINEKTAQENGFSQDDLKWLYKGLWSGTKELNTRSKFNHLPRLLVSITYNQSDAQVGDLDLCVKLANGRNINSFKDVKLDINLLIERLEASKEKINKIEYIEDPDLKYVYNKVEIEKFTDVISKSKAGFSVNCLNLTKSGDC